MPPDQIVFIRHGEEPDGKLVNGVTINGDADANSLSARGWQRAGALVNFFLAANAPVSPPNIVYAHATGETAKSRRSIQTATPLVERLRASGKAKFNTDFLPDQHGALARDITRRKGIVLVVWEHKQIPAIIAKLKHAPATPKAWPERYDVCWVLDRRKQGGWRFSELAQMLLAGDEKV